MANATSKSDYTNNLFSEIITFKKTAETKRKDSISLADAILNWIASGNAEDYRKEYLEFDLTD